MLTAFLLLSSAVGADEISGDTQVCATKTGTLYHDCSCSFLAAVWSRPGGVVDRITLREAAERKLSADTACAAPAMPAGLAPTPPPPTPTPVVEVAFVTSKPTNIRSKHEATGKVVKLVPPLTLLRTTERVDEWLAVIAYTDSDARGWIYAPATEDENLLALSAYDAAARIRDVDPAWPLATRLDIVRGRVRPGFSQPMVELAMGGHPDAKKTSETAAGVVERWAYGNKVITLTNGKVTEIETLEVKQ